MRLSPKLRVSGREANDRSFSSKGVLRPYRLLGWWKWMYRVSPDTYVVDRMIARHAYRYVVHASSSGPVDIELAGTQYLEVFKSIVP